MTCDLSSSSSSSSLLWFLLRLWLFLLLLFVISVKAQTKCVLLETLWYASNSSAFVREGGEIEGAGRKRRERDTEREGRRRKRRKKDGVREKEGHVVLVCRLDLSQQWTVSYVLFNHVSLPPCVSACRTGRYKPLVANREARSSLHICMYI